MKNLETLFQTVMQINDRYNNLETFNVFNAIGFFNQERMHSSFIAEMLNPKGTHRMNNLFLELFLQRVPVSNKNFDSSNAKATVEQRADSRWIDILISNGKNEVIVIENKIYAHDQDRQLEDYYNSCKKEDNLVEMIYLTLDGKKPTSKSVGPVLQMEDVVCISYEKHILPWIDTCAALHGLPPRVKCTLEMYSELLNTLINKNKYMNEIFEELKKNKKNLKLAFDIQKSLEGKNYLKEFPEIKNFLLDIMKNDFDELINTYDGDSDLDFEFNDSEKIKNGWSLFIANEEVYFQDNFNHFCNLFFPNVNNDQLLQSLLIEDREAAYNILYEKLIEAKRINDNIFNHEPSQSI